MRRPGLAAGWLSWSAFFVATAAVASTPPEALPYHELDPDPRLLAVTSGLDDSGFAELLDRIEAQGFTVPLAFVGAGIVVLDEAGAEAALRREPAVSAVHRNPVPRTGRSPLAHDDRSAGMLRWWNGGFETPAADPGARDRRHDVQLCAGGFTAPPGAARDLRCNPGGRGAVGKVHFAAGRIVVNLVLPESYGAGTSIDWRGQDIETVTAELARALNWWSLKSGRQASFLLDNHGLAGTAHEPAALSIGQEPLYIEECLQSLGVERTCAYTMLDDFNRARKEALNAHWACTQFILNAEQFPGSGALAYAYLGGPHTVALRGNGSLSIQELDRVIAHEFGHIFQAADEYASGCGGCGGAWGYFDTPNGNCDTQLCSGQEGACVMRGGGEYTDFEMHHMEIYVNPCRWTKEMVGWRDVDGDGTLDVRETKPETIFISSLPDTVESSRNISVLGRAWDEPFPSPPGYVEDVTINSIVNVQFSVSNRPWGNARAIDGLWTSAREDFEVRLPEMGGGSHTLLVRATNTVWADDPTPARLSFFVYDVMLRNELEIRARGGAFELSWQVDGEDFGSVYRLYRRPVGEAETLLAELDSPGGWNPELRYTDGTIRPGFDYFYRLEVDIPGKGTKLLSQARSIAVLPDPPPGRLASIAPNPFRREVLLSVRVPRGPRAPRPDTPGLPGSGDDPGPNLDNAPPGLARDGSDDDEIGEVDPSLPWRTVGIRVYDVRGRLVRDLGVERRQETTRFNLRWDGRSDRGTSAPAGVYFLRLDFGYTSETNKIILLR